MFHTLKLLNYPVVLGVAAVGFVLGWLWYSPLLFAKAWMKEMGFTKESFAKLPKSTGYKMLASCLALTGCSTTTLAVLLTEHQELVPDHPSLGALGGAKVGLFVGVGLLAVREAVNHLFTMKRWKLFFIVAGYDVVLCTVQGALLGMWLWSK